MNENNEIMNEEVTNVTTEIAETNSGSVLDALAITGAVVATGFGIYKLVKFIVKKVKAKKEAKEAEYEVIDEPVDDSDVEESDD